MVRICTRWNLRFKDVKELNKLSHILESQLATCIYSYHIRQVKMPIIFWNTERGYRAGIKYQTGIKIPGWEGARASRKGNEIYFDELRFEDVKELAEFRQILELQLVTTIYSYHIW